MKPSAAAWATAGVVVAAGAAIYSSWSKTTHVSVPVVASSSELVHRDKIPGPTRDMSPDIPAGENVSTPTTPAVVDDEKVDNATLLARAVDALLSPQASWKDKQVLWKQLKDAGELDQVIAELKMRAANDPTDAAVLTALGFAYLSKLPLQDPNETGILAMEADQSFNAALQLDPSNWEAQFLKAQSLSYWPPGLNKGQEVIQRFTSLIDQQNATTPQPEFAQTYALLGDEYQRLGQSAQATQTWQLGLQKYPSNAALLKRITNPPVQ